MVSDVSGRGSGSMPEVTSPFAVVAVCMEAPAMWPSGVQQDVDGDLGWGGH